jgi:DNA repair protein RadA
MPKAKKVIKENTKEFDVNSLQSIDGLGPVTAKKLNELGIESPLDFIVLSDEEVHIMTDMDIYKAGVLLMKVQKTLEEQGVIPVTTDWAKYQVHQALTYHIPTGCKSLDEILRGGIESQAVTEVYGEDGAGKTQFILSTIAEALHNDADVLVMDCEGTFVLKRLLEIAQSRGYTLDENKLKRLHVEVLLDGLRIEHSINRLIRTIKEHNIKLIAIDGAIGVFRYEYHEGRGELNPRQNRLKLIHRIKKACIYMNVAAVITNQVMGNPDQYPGAPKMKSVGGFIIGHAVKYIIHIQKRGSTRRVAEFSKSNQDGKSEAEFWLNEAGVSDHEILPKKPKGEIINA